MKFHYPFKMWFGFTASASRIDVVANGGRDNFRKGRDRIEDSIDFDCIKT